MPRETPSEKGTTEKERRNLTQRTRRNTKEEQDDRGNLKIGNRDKVGVPFVLRWQVQVLNRLKYVLRLKKLRSGWVWSQSPKFQTGKPRRGGANEEANQCDREWPGPPDRD